METDWKQIGNGLETNWKRIGNKLETDLETDWGTNWETDYILNGFINYDNMQLIKNIKR